MVLLQQIINGVMLGSTYALVAIGYSLIFGVLRLLHFAHGEVFMVGAFIALCSVWFLNAGPVLAVVCAAVGCAVLGVVIEFVAFRPVRRRSGGMLAPIVSSLGVGLLLQEVATNIFGADQTRFPPQFEATVYHFGSLFVTSTQLFILATSFGLMLLVHLFISKTKYGLAMRAVAENVDVAGLLGINSNAVVVLTFAVASALGGIAGVLVGFAFSAISPFMGISMTIKGLVVMLIGGLGNVYGAMIGGLVLGIAEVLTVGYLASSYRDAFSFALLILVLLVRPQGLFAGGLRAGH
ncbi:branched-chain amino acid ABC transporter permease [Roseiarcaceae bacterium H3SJ34-1]|uniref:branched-chain amino acid ABC transporter permease n=1 Tax=Terripilifer ovatus TaxID=3032367 RepID=UPI003AB97042|nr:branched-chain amino acid ABC transporter permease [Roseiarcaceae bacterium H3SJ34-1]